MKVGIQDQLGDESREKDCVFVYSTCGYVSVEHVFVFVSDSCNVLSDWDTHTCSSHCQMCTLDHFTIKYNTLVYGIMSNCIPLYWQMFFFFLIFHSSHLYQHVEKHISVCRTQYSSTAPQTAFKITIKLKQHVTTWWRWALLQGCYSVAVTVLVVARGT